MRKEKKIVKVYYLELWQIQLTVIVTRIEEIEEEAKVA